MVSIPYLVPFSWVEVLTGTGAGSPAPSGCGSRTPVAESISSASVGSLFLPEAAVKKPFTVIVPKRRADGNGGINNAFFLTERPMGVDHQLRRFMQKILCRDNHCVGVKVATLWPDLFNCLDHAMNADFEAAFSEFDRGCVFCLGHGRFLRGWLWFLTVYRYSSLNHFLCSWLSLSSSPTVRSSMFLRVSWILLIKPAVYWPLLLEIPPISVEMSINCKTGWNSSIWIPMIVSSGKVFNGSWFDGDGFAVDPIASFLQLAAVRVQELLDSFVCSEEIVGAGDDELGYVDFWSSSFGHFGSHCASGSVWAALIKCRVLL